MADISNNLYLRIAVAGAAEADEEIDSISLSLEKLGTTSEETGKKLKSGGLFGALTNLKSLIAGYSAIEAVKSYSAFTSQMMRLKTQAGATTQEMNKQSKAIMGMAVSVGTGPMSLAQGMYHLESAGYRGAKATNMLRQAAELAQIGGANLSDTITGLTAGMISFGSKTMTASKIMGLMNATVGTGDMTLENLNEGIGTGILSTLKTLGLRFNDFGAAMATFGDMNIRGAAAANRLRMSLMTLVHPSEVSTKAMAAIGLTQYQLAAALRQPNGLLAMLDLLHQKLAGQSKLTVETDLASIFGGGKNSAGMLSLYNNMGRLESKYHDIAVGQNNFQKAWQNTQHTLAFTLSQLKALGEVLLIKVGGGLAKIVKPTAQFLKWLITSHGAAGVLRDMLLAVAGALAVMKVKAELAALATVILESDFWASLTAAIALAAGITSIGDAFAFLSLMIDSVPLIGWIALAITAIILLVTHWKSVTKFAGQALHTIVSGLKAAWKWITGAANLVGKVFVGAWHELKHAMDDVWKMVKKVFDFIIGKGGTVSKIFSYLNPLGLAHHVLGGLSSIGSAISGVFANGGMTPTAGTFVVGERGPELVSLPAGANIYPANSEQTNAALGGGIGGTQVYATIPISISLDGKAVAQGVVHQSLVAQARS